ncbi:MAG: WD40 repeat [Glomeribacter sp. 1016415]|nr:WD40 repeat [Glomeribacter sp. 1016415]
MLGGVFSSAQSALSSKEALDLANFYLESARQTKAPNIALVLCENAEASLSQMKRALKRAQMPQSLADQTLRNKVGQAYFERGQLLENLGQSEKAQTSYEKAEKWGYIQSQVPSSVSSPPSSLRLSIQRARSIPSSFVFDGNPQHFPLLDQPSIGSDITLLYPHIFAKNVPLPLPTYTLPEADARLSSSPQLAYALNVLSAASLPDAPLSPEERTWSQATAKNADETERLHTLATNVVSAFIQDALKEVKTVNEVVCVALSAEQALSRNLLAELVKKLQQSPLLASSLLEGIDQLIHQATPGTLAVDDLVQLLTLLNKRLQETHAQASVNLYQLTRTISHVLDAMADSEVTGLQREPLHEPLAAYLKTLQGSEDPYLVYQAAYALQALQYVPDDETPWQAAQRRTEKVIKGIFGLVSAVKGIDINQFIEGLGNIQQGVSGAADLFKMVKEAYEGGMSLMESGQNFFECIKEGFSFTRKSTWYPALRLADTLLQTGQLAQFKQLICEESYRRDPAFQWGLAERLGQLAANPLWDIDTRQHALDFLGQLYQDEATWRPQANVQQWVVRILSQLANSTSDNASAAKTVLQTLSVPSQQDNSREARLDLAPPLPVTSALLDRVQNNLHVEIESKLRGIKHRRIEAHGDAVYIPPQGKPSLQASDEKLFDLTDKVNDFLADSTKKVCLLLGDSGAGKSTFNRMLETNLWKAYQKGGRIPLFIHLPAIDKPEHDLITKALRKEGLSEPQIKELKAYRECIVICDGYDESQQTHNLYMSNRLNQAGEWRVQMVISCRSEYFGADSQDRFQPIDRNHHANTTLFEEAVIAPFSAQKIASYIDQYVQIKKRVWTAEVYQQALDRIPHLKELVRNPFLLTLALEVLPSLVNPGQDFSSTRITRVALYDQFIVQWLERGKKRLAEKVLSEQKKEAFERLSSEGFTRNGLAFLAKLATAIYEQQAGNPVVEYTRFIDEGTWKEVFFGRDDEKQLLLEASPLSRSDNQYRFIHKSLLEYAVARAICEPQASGKSMALTPTLTRRGSVSSVLSFESQHAADDVALAVEQPLLNSLLARKNLVGQPSILQFLAERVKPEPLFKQQLLAVIERSKTDPKPELRKAAANAITILVRAGIRFKGADLKGIRIPGADLSHGVFEAAQLQGADLRKVSLRNSLWREANLNGAKMEGVWFGEWPYLQEESPVKSCVYSPDGKACAVGLKNGAISVYATSNWEKIFTLVGHTDEVDSVVYSPSSDQIASGSFDRTVRLWNARTGEAGPILAGHTKDVNSVAYSPSGQQIASGSDDETVRLWNAHTGEAGSILEGHTNTVWGVVYSPSGQQIASASKDHTVRLWNAQTGEADSILVGHTDGVCSVVYSPSGQQIASGSMDQTVRLWDAHTGEAGPTLAGHTGTVCSMVYSPSGQQIASGSYDKTVRLWDAQTGETSSTLAGHTDVVWSVVYSPNGQQIASGSADQTMRLWDPQTGEAGPTLEGHTDTIWSVVYSPSGQQIASGSEDNTVRLWNAQTGENGPTLIGHTDAVYSVVYSPSGQQIASGSLDNTVQLWDAQTGEDGPTLIGHTSAVMSVVYSPSGQQIASASGDKTVRLWNAYTGEAGPTLEGHTGTVCSMVFSPSGQQIASGSYDKTVRLWDAQTGETSSTLTGHTDLVMSVVYSPSGQQIASASEDKTVRLWNAYTGEAGPTLEGHTDAVYSVVYSPSEQQIASGSFDKTVRLWDVASGQCLMVGRDFNGVVTSIAWKATPEGNYLVTGSADKAVRVWQIIEKEGQYQLRLHWSSSQNALTVTDAFIQGVQGLSRINQQLLQQRGAVGEPALRLGETSQRAMSVVTAVSKFKAPLRHKTLDTPPTTLLSSVNRSLPAKEQHLLSHLA